jgi:hypothetical protein
MLFLMQRSPLLYAFFKRKADPRAEVALILMVAGFGLDGSIIDVEFISMKPLLLLIVSMTLIYTAVFYSGLHKKTKIAATIFGLLFVAASYSFGLAVVADTLLDRSEPSTYTVPVTGKHTTSGKSTSYYLELAPWGPLQKPNQISVSSSFYDDTAPGDQICLALHPGRLNASWYQLSGCPAQPASELRQ